MPKPWERQPGETMLAFQAFSEYLRLGATRSAPEVAANLGKGLLALRKWQERHGWVERATQWDAFLVEQEQAAAVLFTKERALTWAKRQEELREAEWEVSQKLLEKARELLRDPKVRWSGGDIARIAEVAQKLGRLGAGMETERRVQELTGDGGGPVKLEVNFEADLKRVYGQVIEDGDGGKREKRQIAEKSEDGEEGEDDGAGGRGVAPLSEANTT